MSNEQLEQARAAEDLRIYLEMKDAVELLPCPFCGSKAYLGTMYVRCHECGCEGPLGPYQEEEEGIALWNTRAVLGEDK